MSKTIRVTAPYVTLKIEDPNRGTYVAGYYEGAIVENVADDSAQHHLDSGLAVSASTGDMPAAPPLLPENLTSLGSSEPAGNASREEWESYARSKGATDEDLLDGEGQPLGRNELRDRYATAE
jgi:hypothetical protein